jgi:hypothetical protein
VAAWLFTVSFTMTAKIDLISWGWPGDRSPARVWAKHLIWRKASVIPLRLIRVALAVVNGLRMQRPLRVSVVLLLT